MKIPAMRLLSVCTLVLLLASLMLAGCQGQLGIDLSLGDGQDGGDAGQVLSNPVVLLVVLVLVLALALGRR